MMGLIERIPTGSTPGPWRAWDNGSYWQVDTTDENWMTGQVADACASKWMHPTSAGDVEDHSEANARLIALAPELAEAVKAQAAEIARLRGLLTEARNQLEYVDEKGPQRGTTAAVIAQLNHALREIGDDE